MERRHFLSTTLGASLLASAAAEGFSPQEKSRVLWIVKGRKLLRQIRIVYDASQGSVESCQLGRRGHSFDFNQAAQEGFRESRVSHCVSLGLFFAPS